MTKVENVCKENKGAGSRELVSFCIEFDSSPSIGIKFM